MCALILNGNIPILTNDELIFIRTFISFPKSFTQWASDVEFTSYIFANIPIMTLKYLMLRPLELLLHYLYTQVYSEVSGSTC